MVCEYCGANMEKGQTACGFCGSKVKTIMMSEKGDTVISLDKQRDIGNYKAPLEDTDTVTIDENSRISQPFAVQTATENTHKYTSDRDVIIRADSIKPAPRKTAYTITDVSGNSISVQNSAEQPKDTAVSQNSSKDYYFGENPENAPETTNPYGDFEQQNKESGDRLDQLIEDIKKRRAEQKWTRKESISSKDISVEFCEGGVILPKNLTKQQLLKVPQLEGVRGFIYFSIIMFYLSAVVGVVGYFLLFGFARGIIFGTLSLGCALALQFTFSRISAVSAVIFAVVKCVAIQFYASIGSVLFSPVSGIFTLTASVLALAGTFLFGKVWDRYKKDGFVPYRKGWKKH